MPRRSGRRFAHPRRSAPKGGGARLAGVRAPVLRCVPKPKNDGDMLLTTWRRAGRAHERRRGDSEETRRRRRRLMRKQRRGLLVRPVQATKKTTWGIEYSLNNKCVTRERTKGEEKTLHRQWRAPAAMAEPKRRR
jgi:hypothetical protein